LGFGRKTNTLSQTTYETSEDIKEKVQWVAGRGHRVGKGGKKGGKIGGRGGERGGEGGVCSKTKPYGVGKS